MCGNSVTLSIECLRLTEKVIFLSKVQIVTDHLFDVDTSLRLAWNMIRI